MTTTPLAIAAKLYDVPEAELHSLRGGHFAQVYDFKRGGRDFILRLSPPNDDVNLTAQKSILAWMSYLAEHGAYVPAPLPSRNGNLIEVVSSSEGEWLAVAYTRAEGVLSETMPLDQWANSQYQVLGRSIGKIHAVARGYVPSSDVSYPDWEAGGNLFNHQIEDEPWLKEKQARLLNQIHALPKPIDAYGLVHGDLHFGNFFVDVRKETITLIDFDDCAYGWFVMDIAILLFDILVLYSGTDKDAYGLNFLRNFLTGYLTQNPLSLFWLEQLPIFLKLLEINIYDMVARFFPDDADEWVMKFMLGRKERLENDMPYVELEYSILMGSK